MLSFLAKPPFGWEDFLAKCRSLIPEDEFEILRRLSQAEIGAADIWGSPSLKQWAGFEIALRNELVRSRAARKKIDPAKFLRLPDFQQAQVSHVALTAYRSSSILEAEKILDQARWNFLEELTFGHYFDFDYLLIYGLKLKILARWEKIQTQDKDNLLLSVTAN